MPDLVTTSLIASASIEAGVILGVLFARSSRREPIGAGRVLLAAGAGALVLAVLAVALTQRVSGSLFYTVHLAYLFCVIVVPACGLALLAGARGARSSRAAKILAVLALAPAAVGGWATFVEPYRLVTERTAVALHPDRAVGDGLRIAVLSDLQSPRVGEHLREAVRRAMDFEPDLILLPGDLLQCRDEVERERAIGEFRRLLAPLTAPLGVWFVLGNCDWPPTVARVLEGTEVRLLANETVRVSSGVHRIVLAGSDFGRRGFDFARGLDEGAYEADEVAILVSHYPDVALELPRASRVDLVVAGHTHGGQVNVPFFGPPITLSKVPREVAAGGLHRLNGNRVYVSRGVGYEGGDAPRIRLNCPPEVSLLTLE